MLRTDTSKHQGHADLIVQIAMCRKRRRFHAEAGSDKLLQSCLAIAAGYTNNTHVLIVPPGRTESAERQTSVVHFYLCNLACNIVTYDYACRSI